MYLKGSGPSFDTDSIPDTFISNESHRRPSSEKCVVLNISVCAYDSLYHRGAPSKYSFPLCVLHLMLIGVRVMASLFKLPSGRKVKSDVDEYKKCIEEDEIEGISGKVAQRQRSDLQKKQQALFEKIPKQDLLVIAQDQAKQAQWIEAHIKYEQSALRGILEELDLGQRARDALKVGNETLMSRLGLLDSKTAAPIEDEDVDLAVTSIRKLMMTMPRVASIVLKDVAPEVQDSIVRQCDEIRRTIQEIRTYVRAEAIKDCENRLFSPHNMNVLVELVQRRDAPQAALRESEELANLRLELLNLNEEVASYIAKDTKQKVANDNDRAALENEKEAKQTAEHKLESVKADEQQAKSHLAAARQEIQQLKGQLFEEQKVEAVKERLEHDLDSQRQAIDAFLEYSTASLAQESASLVVAPSAEELTTLHANYREVALNQSEQLPTIVVASGHLPAAFSYLCLASGGVLSASRFNHAVTSSKLLWVSDTLDRVVKAIAAAQEAVPDAVLIVLLQGIAYVHLATRFTTATTSPTPKDMLNSLYKLIPRTPQRTVLATVYRLVSRLVYFQSSITSWISDDSPLDRRINSSNSALPDGITLIHSAGYLFLQESATDGERLFIIEPEAVQIVAPQMGHTDMILPPVNGFSLRRLEIARRLEHASTSSWLRDNGLI